MHIPHMPVYDERTFALSVYSEAIATVCRQGAPLALYAIDRTRLKTYTSALAHEAT